MDIHIPKTILSSSALKNRWGQWEWGKKLNLKVFLVRLNKLFVFLYNSCSWIVFPVQRKFERVWGERYYVCLFIIKNNTILIKFERAILINSIFFSSIWICSTLKKSVSAYIQDFARGTSHINLPSSALQRFSPIIMRGKSSIGNFFVCITCWRN